MYPKAQQVKIAWMVLNLLLYLLLAGCQAGEEAEETPQGETEMTIQLTSNAFSEGKNIPRKHTCDGENLSPQLSWSGVPANAQSLALIMDDPDAPGRTFVHWVLFDIPPTVTELPEGVQNIGVPGSNSYRKNVYNGPCPPPGPAHRYFFKLYALDKQLKLAPGATKADLEAAMQGHILAWGQLMGKYGR